jgi:hypothetical protein
MKQMGGRLMQRLKHMMFIIWVVLLGLGLTTAVGQAADVDVLLEGAYTDQTLVAEIYADITSPILSYGIKITYPASLLTLTSAEKNEATWYFGDGTPAGNKPYADPDTETPGEIIIIGGILDTGAPTAGVTGQRVLLGKLTFDRQESSMPPATPLTLDVTYAKPDPYKNFVQTDGTVLDDVAGVSFISGVYERGDANADGVLTNSDMFAVRQLLIDNVYKVYADCNNDLVLTNSDMFCIRGKL